MRSLTTAQFNEIRKLLKSGKLTTSNFLELAKDKNNCLHALIEWDNKKAADNYRKMQARTAIKRYNVSVCKSEDKIIHVPVIEKIGEGEYKEAGVVVQNIDQFELAMEEALSKVEAAQKSVDILNDVAIKDAPDKTVILAQVMKSLSIASSALNKIH